MVILVVVMNRLYTIVRVVFITRQCVIEITPEFLVGEKKTILALYSFDYNANITV